MTKIHLTPYVDPDAFIMHPELVNPSAPAMEAEPVAGQDAQHAALYQMIYPFVGDDGSTRCLIMDLRRTFLAHPQDAESLRGEVERLDDEVQRHRTDRLSLLKGLKDAEAERDAALTRVAELEARLTQLGFSCEDEGCPHYNTAHGHGKALTPQPDAEVEALVARLDGASRKAASLIDFLGLKGASKTTLRRLVDVCRDASTALRARNKT